MQSRVKDTVIADRSWGTRIIDQKSVYQLWSIEQREREGEKLRVSFGARGFCSFNVTDTYFLAM